jgi:alkaline phosphatase D
MAAMAGVTAVPWRAGALSQPRLGGNPFTLGVASGDPVADGVVLWTRLAPAPLDGGGMPPEPILVEWLVATDERMATIVARGTTVARPERAHAVHVEVQGLEPDRVHWYRFRVGPDSSPVGRTRTAPVAGARLDRFRFAFASCQHFEQGYFAAYRHMLADDLDLVVHLGDYVYEAASWAGQVRRHEGPEPTTLEEYRNRHALYKLDRDLQLAHAAYPWAVIWDDHEVQNDYAGDQSQDRDDPRTFLRRRAAAYQAYYEHMPLRRLSMPRGPQARLYHRLTFGDLVELSLLDTRQYRSDQPCGEDRGGGGNLVSACAARHDPAATMLGAEQERWLLAGLERAATRWNVVAQAQLMAELKQRDDAGRVAYWTDGWDGYAAARQRLLQHVARHRVPNVVVLGGDIHSFWVTDLKPDFSDPRAPTVATEFVGTSITSAGVPHDRFAAFLPDNPHVRFFDSRQRGYVRCLVTPERWQADLRVVDDARDPRSDARTLQSFAVESGRPGALRA